MTQIVTLRISADEPPTKWGPLKWDVDGMTAEKAQAVMRAFMVYTHSLESLAEILHVGEFAAEEMLNRASAIPKQVAFYIPDLLTVMKKSPAKMVQAMKQSETYTPASREVRLRTSREINADVTKKAGEKIRARRQELGIGLKELADRLGVRNSELSSKERLGITPYCNFFFPLCEALNIAPESFGFISYFAATIQTWRRQKRVAKRGRYAGHGQQ